MLKINQRTHVGDGVYAWFDGYQIWVTLSPEATISVKAGAIALNDEVLENLTILRQSFNLAREQEVENDASS